MKKPEQHQGSLLTGALLFFMITSFTSCEQVEQKELTKDEAVLLI